MDLAGQDAGQGRECGLACRVYCRENPSQCSGEVRGIHPATGREIGLTHRVVGRRQGLQGEPGSACGDDGNAVFGDKGDLLPRQSRNDQGGQPREEGLCLRILSWDQGLEADVAVGPGEPEPILASLEQDAGVQWAPGAAALVSEGDSGGQIVPVDR